MHFGKIWDSFRTFFSDKAASPTDVRKESITESPIDPTESARADEAIRSKGIFHSSPYDDDPYTDYPALLTAVSDKRLLLKVAKNAAVVQYRVEAARKLVGTPFIEELRTDSSAWIRRIVVDSTQKESLLIHFALHDLDDYVATGAAEKLSGASLLRVAMEAKHLEAFRKSVFRIEEVPALAAC